MDIAILNYQTNKVEIISNCPDIWSIADVEDQLQEGRDKLHVWRSYSIHRKEIFPRTKEAHDLRQVEEIEIQTSRCCITFPLW